jgi:ribose transport system substrate-binding protein
MRTLAIAPAIALLVALCGCQPKAGPPGPSGLPPTGETPSPTGTGGEGHRIAVVPKGTTHTFWRTVQAGAKKAGGELNAEILWNGPAKETDRAGQIAIIEDFISAKVDALVMAACDAKALVPTVQQALKARIPVITIDSGIATDDALSFVATDNVKGAEQAGEKLAELIGEEGEVGLIPFIKGAATSDMREEGFRKAIARYPNITIASTLYSQSSASDGMKAAENMLTSNPDLKGIFAANEPGAIGAAQAIKQRKLVGKVKLVAFDAADAEIRALEEGVIQALVVQDPFEMGYEGVRLAVDAIQGKEVPKVFDTGVALVTLENMDDPEIHKLLYPELGEE